MRTYCQKVPNNLIFPKTRGQLSKMSPTLKLFIQRLRREAHHFQVVMNDGEQMCEGRALSAAITNSYVCDLYHPHISGKIEPLGH